MMTRTVVDAPGEDLSSSKPPAEFAHSAANESGPASGGTRRR
jgi:hypothetical protein